MTHTMLSQSVTWQTQQTKGEHRESNPESLTEPSVLPLHYVHDPKARYVQQKTNSQDQPTTNQLSQPATLKCNP